MKTILVLGGYGGFGGRLSRLLAARGYHVLVGGRNLQKAQAFCQTVANTTGVAADREQDLAGILAKLKLDLVIDAAGPFQDSSYSVPQHCIAAQTDYLDLADGRDFVAGIHRLDAAAKASGVTVISGASSVPALSGAVVRELSGNLDQLTAIEMAISASNQATAGPSVSAAILSYVGKPIALRRGGRSDVGYGWQELTKETFGPARGNTASERVVGLADVPDLSLLPSQYPGISAVQFRAGTELRFQNRALWLASWMVRWKWVRSLRPLAKTLLWLQTLTRSWGTDISAMKVRVFGYQEQQAVEKNWTLVARRGDGPQIPVFATVLLAEKILQRRARTGAYDASQTLTLTEFQDLFDAHAIDHETVVIASTASVYQRVLGDRFEDLAPSLAQLHAVHRDAGFIGEAVVTQGPHPIARLVARLFGFPPPGHHDLHVHIAARDGEECWTRTFSGQKFSSRLRQTGPNLTESFGPFRFHFQLPQNGNELSMALVGWQFGPIPLPLFLAPQSPAREWEEDGLFHLDVPIILPVFGLMVHYRGTLEPIGSPS